MTTVDISFTKYDGRPHRHSTGRLLGSDEYGTWLGSPIGSVVRYYATDALVANKVDYLRLVPPGAWWTAIFLGGDVEPLLYIDIATPAVWPAPDRVTFVDLDLDVEQYRDGSVVLLDEDEFAEHRVQFGYPPELVAEATAAADFLVRAVTERREPFASVYRSWLAKI